MGCTNKQSVSLYISAAAVASTSTAHLPSTTVTQWSTQWTRSVHGLIFAAGFCCFLSADFSAFVNVGMSLQSITWSWSWSVMNTKKKKKKNKECRIEVMQIEKDCMPSVSPPVPV